MSDTRDKVGAEAEVCQEIQEPSVVAHGTPPVTDGQFRYLCDRSLDAMILTDDSGSFLYVNPVACDLFGYSREQMLRMRFDSLVVSDNNDTETSRQEYVQTGRVSGEVCFLRADGDVRTASYAAYRLVSGHHLRTLHDITVARRAEQKLRESEQERAHVMASARCLIWYADITDSDHPDQLYWDSRFVDPEAAQQFLPLYIMPGESYDIARRRARLPADREACDRLGTAAIRAGRSYDQEFRCRAANGDIHWMHEDIHVETVVEGQRWRAVGVCTDITARKQHLQEIETLNTRLKQAIQETHHRVQNNLQMVAALVEIQMAEGETLVPNTALARIGQHARSLAAIHDLLVRDSETGVEANSLSAQAVVGQLLLLLQECTRGRRLHYAVTDFRLSIQAGGSLALLLSELISNAARHSKTEIGLTLTVTDNIVRLEIYDDGSGFPSDFDWRTSAKTGMGLIDGTGRYELRGAISYGNRPEGGACVVVTFPLPALPPKTDSS
jgi:PAS domain S-box-containing protein